MSHFQTETRDRTVLVTMDREPMNALDLKMLEEGARRFRQLASDPPAHGIVLTGAHGVFTAGIDRAELPQAEKDTAHRLRLVAAINNFAAAIHRLPCAVVCAIPGHCIGAGSIACLASDWTVAADVEAQIGLPQAMVGVPFPPVQQVILDYGLEPVWRRRLAFSSQLIGPHEAVQVGLADEVVEPDDLLPAALSAARRMEGQQGFRDVKKSLRSRANAEINQLLLP